MQDRTVQLAERTHTPSQATTQVDEYLRRSRTADGLLSLLVDVHTDLGLNCQPVGKVPPGTTVTATVTIDRLTATCAGRARGIAFGSGGRAMITVNHDFHTHFDGVLTAGAWVTICGTVTHVSATKGISVRSVWKAVAAGVGADESTDTVCLNHPASSLPSRTCGPASTSPSSWKASSTTAGSAPRHRSSQLMPDDACVLCGWWNCRCGKAQFVARGAAVAGAVS